MAQDKGETALAEVAKRKAEQADAESIGLSWYPLLSQFPFASWIRRLYLFHWSSSSKRKRICSFSLWLCQWENLPDAFLLVIIHRAGLKESFGISVLKCTHAHLCTHVHTPGCMHTHMDTHIVLLVLIHRIGWRKLLAFLVWNAHFCTHVHTWMHAHTHTHMHMQAHTRTHTHTHTQSMEIHINQKKNVWTIGKSKLEFTAKSLSCQSVPSCVMFLLLWSDALDLLDDRLALDNGFHGNHADEPRDMEENIVDQVQCWETSLHRYDHTLLLILRWPCAVDRC